MSYTVHDYKLVVRMSLKCVCNLLQIRNKLNIRAMHKDLNRATRTNDGCLGFIGNTCAHLKVLQHTWSSDSWNEEYWGLFHAFWPVFHGLLSLKGSNKLLESQSSLQVGIISHRGSCRVSIISAAEAATLKYLRGEFTASPYLVEEFGVLPFMAHESVTFNTWYGKNGRVKSYKAMSVKAMSVRSMSVREMSVRDIFVRTMSVSKFSNKNFSPVNSFSRNSVLIFEKMIFEKMLWYIAEF